MLVVALFAMMFAISNAQAQDPKYSRMLEDLVDGKYERVLFRAIGFTEKESTKKASRAIRLHGTGVLENPPKR